jgi:hypothetical protein
VLVILAAVVVVLVHLPALQAPLILDDNAHIAMIDGTYVGQRGALNLFDFIDDSNRAAAMDLGVIPWWTTPDFRVRFFRPLASALLWVDYRVFGHGRVLAHLDSLVWWGVAAVAVYALLARAFSRRVGLLGGFVFALAACHALPLAWVASRSALVSTALGALALGTYARWREQRRLVDGVASAALFLLASGAGEYTLCFAGYVLALEATRGRESVARRAVGVASFALPMAAYLVARSLLHYGAQGGGLYHDPLHDLGAFTRGAARRLGVLLMSAWLAIDDHWAAAAPAATLTVMTVVGAAVLAIPIWKTIASLDPEQKPRAAWLLAGSFISIAPVLSVEANIRLLGPSMIGVSATIALLIDRAWFPPVAEPRRGWTEVSSFVALGLAFIHLARAPINALIGLRAVAALNGADTERLRWVAEHARGHSEVVAIRATSGAALVFAPFSIGASAPVRWRILSFMSGRPLLLRTGERTIELVAGSDKPLFPVGPGELFRDRDELYSAGDVVHVDGMKVTIVQIDDKNGLPKRIRYEFDRDLDDPSILWVTEGDWEFREHALPKKGYGEPIPP